MKYIAQTISYILHPMLMLEKPNKFDPFGQKELTLLATI